MIYYGLGLKSDALVVLEKAPAHPLITLWKAYLKDDSSLLNEVTVASPAFVFPFRTETVSALKWALSRNNNWKFKYYLALNYTAIQHEADVMNLLESCGQEPDYVPFYLTRAAMQRSKDESKELMDLQTAQKLAPDDWRTANRLTAYYERHQNNQMALNISSAAYQKHKDNFTIGLQYATTLLNNGQYANCIKTLEATHILPPEGTRQGKIIYEQACLYLAMDLTRNKKYGEAIKEIEKSKEWPENLGVGKPYDVDIRIQDYLKIFCLEKMNRSKEAEALGNSIVEYTNKNPLSPSFSNILAIRILKERGESEAANTLVQKIDNSANSVQKWVVATSLNDQATISDLEKTFSKNTDFMILKKLIEVTGK